MGVFSKKNVNTYTPFQPPMQLAKTHELQTNSIIGKSMHFKGVLMAEEEVTIEGVVEGTVKSEGVVIIGKNGRVTADIFAREITIKGEVNGNVTGREKVEIVPQGVLNGNIISQRVVLAEGAIFKGNIDMSLKGPISKPLHAKAELKAAVTTKMHPKAK